MTTAISINPPAEACLGAAFLAEGNTRRRESGCAPSDSMIAASLPKQYGFNAGIYAMPMPIPMPVAMESASKLSNLSAISDYFASREGIDPGAHVQTGDIERPELERQLSAIAVNLVIENSDAADNEECRALAAFCKEAYLDLHAHLSTAKFHACDEDAKALSAAKGAVLNAAGAALSNAMRDSSGGPDDISIEARQLRQWSRDNDIGLEILRMFVATWNRIRNTMRRERQFEIAEIRQLSDQAVAALIKQGQDKFQQDALNAWASIASSIVQLAPIGVHAVRQASLARKNGRTLNINLGNENIVSEHSAYIKATRQLRGNEINTEGMLR